jgi:[acyl-carrier-protein] S-malonyltransferase
MKIGMVFPGYGSQYVGMGKELYDNSRIMQEYFEEASNCLSINFVKLCFASSDSEISRIDNAILSNFLISTSLQAIVKETFALKPDVMVGHDVGQCAALFACGGISFPDMLYLLQKYAAFYQEVLDAMPSKGLRVLGMPKEQLSSLCSLYTHTKDLAFISVYESEIEHVVAGAVSAIDDLREQVLAAGAKKAIELPLVEGLHSPMMQHVEENLRIYGEKVDFKDLTVPLMATTDGSLLRGKDECKAEMLRAVVTPINWALCVELLEPYDLLIEIGPGTELATALRKKYAEKKIVSINKQSDIEELGKIIAADKKDDVVDTNDTSKLE